MSLAVEDLLTEPLVERISNAVAAKIAAIAMPQRWVNQADYALYYGISAKTVRRRKSFLRSKGAVLKMGNEFRYDKTVTPLGDRVVGKFETARKAK